MSSTFFSKQGCIFCGETEADHNSDGTCYGFYKINSYCRFIISNVESGHIVNTDCTSFEWAKRLQTELNSLVINQEYALSQMMEVRK